LKYHYSILSAVLLVFSAPVKSETNESNAAAVVLAVASISDMTLTAGEDLSFGLRPRIVTRLVRDYNCVVLSRSSSSMLMTEGQIGRFNAVVDLNKKEGLVWAADYAIKMSLRDKGVKNMLTVTANIQDLRRDEDIEPMSIEIDTTTAKEQSQTPRNGDGYDYDWIADQVVAKISQTLRLKKQAARVSATEGVLERGKVFAVLPITRKGSDNKQSSLWRRLELRSELPHLTDAESSSLWLRNRARGGREFARLPDWCSNWKERSEKAEPELLRLDQEALAASSASTAEYSDERDSLRAAFELALQESSVGVKIVDRTVLQGIIRELGITSMQGVNENLGGKIAHLAGADYLLAGFLAKSEAGGLCLNMHLVDARTSVLLSAFDIYGKNEEMLALLSENAVNEILLKASIPELKPSPEWRRQREAGFYHLFDWNLGSSQWLKIVQKSPNFKASCLDRIEASAMLMQDDPQFIMEKVAPAVCVILGELRPAFRMQAPPRSPDASCRGVELLDALLTRTPGVEKYGHPLLRRATAHLSILDYRESLRLAEEHLRQSPRVEQDWAKLICLESLYGLRQYERAEMVGKEIVESDSSNANPPKDIPKLRSVLGSYRDIALQVLDEMACDHDVKDTALQLYCHEKGRVSYPCTPDHIKCIMAMREQKGLGAAIELAQTVDRFETQFLLAEYLIEAGRVTDAEEVCRRLLNTDTAKGAKMLLEDMGQNVAEKEQKGMIVLKKGHEICPFPEQYKIYCFPVEGASEKKVALFAKSIGERFGTRVVVKDPLPLPAGTFEKEHHEFFGFSRQLLQNAEIPDDAIFVYFLTDAPLSIKNYEGFAPDGGWWGNPVLYPTDGPYGDPIGGFIAKDFTSRLLSHQTNEWDLQPYITPSSCELPNRVPGVGKCSSAEGMCPACAELYKTGFDTCYKNLQAFAHREQAMLAPRSIGRNPICHSRSGISWQDKDKVKGLVQMAEEGDTKAQHKVAYMLMYGLGMVGDEKKALEMFESCAKNLIVLADKGDVEAQTDLGMLYEKGWGVPQDHKEALKWYYAAAKGGDAKGACAAGMMVYRGLGTPKNIEDAKKFWQMAEDKGYTRASYSLGGMFENAKAYRSAYESYRKAAEGGSCCGMSGLARCYYYGRGIEQNRDEADKWAIRGTKLLCPHSLWEYQKQHSWED